MQKIDKNNRINELKLNVKERIKRKELMSLFGLVECNNSIRFIQDEDNGIYEMAIMKSNKNIIVSSLYSNEKEWSELYIGYSGKIISFLRDSEVDFILNINYGGNPIIKGNILSGKIDDILLLCKDKYIEFILLSANLKYGCSITWNEYYIIYSQWDDN